MGAARREVAELRRRLGEVEDQREALADGALAVFRMVELLAPLQVDQLHALPNVIRAEVTMGVRRGAAAVLASVQLRSGIHLVGLEPGFLATASAMTR